jgi:hypothetical protein
MTAIGGSIQSVEIKGRTFPVAADADSTRKKGGFENELKMNGNATARLIKTRVGWAINDLEIEIDDNRDDQGFLQTIADTKDFVPMSVTYVSGFTHGGKGQILGEVGAGSQNATSKISIGGPGTLAQQ